MYDINKWDLRYLRMAKEVSGWSNDPVKKVGCVLTNEKNRVVSTGCNGLPAGMDRLVLPREQIKVITLHAEVNALLDCKRPFYNCYVWPSAPCAPCMAQLAQAGCRRVISTAQASDEWYPDLTMLIVTHYNIEVVIHELS